MYLHNTVSAVLDRIRAYRDIETCQWDKSMCIKHAISSQHFCVKPDLTLAQTIAQPASWTWIIYEESWDHWDLLRSNADLASVPTSPSSWESCPSPYWVWCHNSIERQFWGSHFVYLLANISPILFGYRREFPPFKWEVAANYSNVSVDSPGHRVTTHRFVMILEEINQTLLQIKSNMCFAQCQLHPSYLLLSSFF